MRNKYITPISYKCEIVNFYKLFVIIAGNV